MSDQLFDQAVRNWLEDGSDRTPPAAIDAVLLAVKTTPQERDLRVPRRFNLMPTHLRLAAGIAVVAVLGLAALTFLKGIPGSGGPPAPTPTETPIPTAIGPTPFPTLSLDTSTWTAFTSSRYGFSARYPATFEAVPSNFLWRMPNAAGNMFDGFHSAGDVKWLDGISAPLPEGATRDDWYVEYRRDIVEDDLPWEPAACFTPREDWSSTTVDGNAADLRVGCEAMEAFVFVAGRVYVFSAFGYEEVTPPTTEPSASDEIRELFELWLTTISLDPASAQEPPFTPTQAPSST